MEKIVITYNGQEIEVDPAIAEALEAERLRKQASDKRDGRHLSDFGLDREDLPEHMRDKPADFTEQIADADEAEQLHRALKTLTEIQRRRVQMYFFDGFTYEQIAEFEGSVVSAIFQSVESALKKLKKILDNT